MNEFFADEMEIDSFLGGVSAEYEEVEVEENVMAELMQALIESSAQGQPTIPTENAIYQPEVGGGMFDERALRQMDQMFGPPPAPSTPPMDSMQAPPMMTPQPHPSAQPMPPMPPQAPSGSPSAFRDGYPGFGRDTSMDGRY